MNKNIKGALLGLAVGDAVGTTVEFKNPGTFALVTDMKGGGPFNLKSGQWTDDTSLALCLAESLIEDGYSPKSQIEKYIKWQEMGYLSSNGKCFDIGLATRNALNDYKDLGDPYSGETGEYSAGNGSLMRLAPIPIYYWNDVDEAVKKAGDSSRITHGNIMCIDACRVYSYLINMAINGRAKNKILDANIVTTGYFSHEKNKLCSVIEDVILGSYKTKQPPEIIGSGFVVKSLEAALWAFYNTDNFKDAILTAVNLGNDADTTAAICGQLAGAFYGIDNIPTQWLEKLTMKDKIEKMAIKLLNK